jgi:Predicted periplasmic protein (DUF2271).
MKKIITSFLLLMVVYFANAQNQTQAVTATNGTLSVTYTASTGSNISALWINSGSTFLRTLYAASNSSYVNDLTNWVSDSKKNVVNATTGATTGISTKTYTWNSKDQTNSSIVSDGTYTIKIELTTEAYGTNGKLLTASFTKGPNAQTLTPTNVTPITGISINWTPANTALNDINLEKQYVAYPNPTRSTVYMSGLDIIEIEVCTIAGKHVFSTNQQTFNLSQLPKGVYLTKVITKNGTFVKKIEKL